MYAFVAIEVDTGEFIAARDPFGVKPLYLINADSGYVFCSEIRPLLETAPIGDILLLPPGHILMHKLFAPFESSVDAALTTPRQDDPAELDRLLSEAVAARAPPDLPFTTLFSGGVDSTLIAHYARQVRPSAPGYFLGAEGAPDYALAAQYADETGYDLRCVPFDVESGDDRFRVALCGEGADEFLAGYLPLEAAFHASGDLGPPIRDQCLASMHRTNLQRVDRCSMRFQIETRKPFLGPRVVNYALGLQSSALVESVAGRPRGKKPLRRLYDLYPGQLPRSIRDREKSPPMRAPASTWRCRRRLGNAWRMKSSPTGN